MGFLDLKNVGFRPPKCVISVLREVGEGFFGKINVGCGIFWPKICGMWDFLAKNMWDMGF